MRSDSQQEQPKEKTKIKEIIVNWIKKKRILQKDKIFQFTKAIDEMGQKILQKDLNCLQFKEFMRSSLSYYGSFEELIQQLCKQKQLAYLKNVLQEYHLNPEQENVVFADKTLQLQHKDMFADYKRLPQGSLQKQLQKQIVFAFERKHNSIPSRFFDETQTKFQELMARIVREECANGDSSLTDTIKKCHQEKDMRYELLCVIRRKIMPINVLELVRLVDETEKVKAKIAKKNVLLMIGTTGSGKTTCILRFLGYRLRKVKCETLTTLSPTTPVKPQHQSFYTSPQAKSVTRYINVAKIPEQMFDQELEDECKDLSICDSPGFGDSGGIEIDIANGVGLINALKQCKSVRIVVIFAKDSLYADKMGGIIAVSQIISYLFKELNKNLLAGITLLFNKFVNSDDIEQFPKLVQNKIKNLKTENSANSNLKKFLQKMKSESEREENYVNPESQDFKNVLQNVVKTLPIKNVADSLQYSFALNTKLEIDNFITKYLEKVKGKFNAAQYQLASFYLSMLAALQKVLVGNNDLESKLREAENFVKAQSDEIYKAFENSLKDIVEEADSQRVYQNIKACIHKIVRVKRLFPTVESLVDRTLIDQQLSKVEGSLLLKLSQFDQKSSERLLKTYKLFATSLREQAPGFEKRAIQTLIELYNTEVGVINELFKKEQFAEMGQPLRKAKFVYNFHSKIQNDKAKQLKYNQLIDRYNKKVLQQLQWMKQTVTQYDMQINVKNNKKEDLLQKKLSSLEIIYSLDLDLNPNLRMQKQDFFKYLSQKWEQQINLLKQNCTSLIQTQRKEYLQKSVRQIKRRKKKIDYCVKISKNQIITNYYELILANIMEQLVLCSKQFTKIFQQIRKAQKIELLQQLLNQLLLLRGLVINLFQIFRFQVNIGVQKNIVEEINQSFKQFIIAQQTNLKNVFKNISSKKPPGQSIKFWAQKIYLFKKVFSARHQLSQNPIENQLIQLQKEFLRITISPLTQFLLDNETNNQPFINSNLSSICSYVKSIQEIFQENELYSEVNHEQQKRLRLFVSQKYAKLQISILKFIQKFKIGQQVDIQLKEAIFALCIIASKPSISQFLPFDIHNLLKDLKEAFVGLGKTCESQFSKHVENENENYSLIIYLQTICEELFTLQKQLKDQSKQSIFEPLAKKIKDYLKKSGLGITQSVQNRVKTILQKEIVPHSFQELAELYNQPHHGSVDKTKRFITSQLRKLLSLKTKSLKKFESKPEFRDIELDELSLQFTTLYHQYLQFCEGIEKVFKKQTQKPFELQLEFIQQRSNRLQKFIMNKYQIIQESLNINNLQNIKKQIQILGSLQLKIYQIKQIKLQKINLFQGQLQSFVQNKVSEFQASRIKNTVISTTLQLYPRVKSKYKAIIQDYSRRYIENGRDFDLNKQFVKIYQALIQDHSSNQSTLRVNVLNYFEVLLNGLSSSLKTSGEQYRNLSKKIQHCIDLLPKDIQRLVSRLYQQKQKQNKVEAKKIVCKIEVNQYLEEYQKYAALDCDIMKTTLLEKLEQTYFNYCRHSSDHESQIQRKLNFFNRIVERNCNKIQKYQQLKRKISLIFRQEVVKMQVDFLHHQSKCKQILKQKNISKSQRANLSHSLEDILVIVKFYTEINSSVVNFQSDKKLYQKSLVEFIQDICKRYSYYHKLLINVSQQALNEDKGKQTRKQFYYNFKQATFYGTVIQEIKGFIDLLPMNQAFKNQKVILQMRQLKCVQSIHHEYNNQLDRIQQQVLPEQQKQAASIKKAKNRIERWTNETLP